MNHGCFNSGFWTFVEIKSFVPHKWKIEMFSCPKNTKKTKKKLKILMYTKMAKTMSKSNPNFANQMMFKIEF